jgi:hypothetical protein
VKAKNPPKQHAADATQEYRGPIVEVVTDVSVELLPDESVDARPLPSMVKRALSHSHSVSPIALDVRAPDASLEFPHPVSPELFADDTNELLANDSGAIAVTREPPRWRFTVITAVMVFVAMVVGGALGVRAGRSDDSQAAATHPKMPRVEIPLVDAPPPAPPAAAPTVSTTGTITSPKWARGRHVFLDGKDVGLSGVLEAACGRHVVKIGPSGKARDVTVPCGGTVSVLP